MVKGEIVGSLSGSMLLFNGEYMTAERNTPDDLASALSSVGSTAINAAIESMYVDIKDRNPDATVSRPSISALRLGMTTFSVLSIYGERNRTGVYHHPLEMRPEHLPYRGVIEDAGFSAHIRRLSTQTGRYDLMLRNPETDPVPLTPLDTLPRALGFIAPAELRTLKPQLTEALLCGNQVTYREAWNRLEDESESAVDKQIENFGNAAGETAKVGKIVFGAVLRVELKGDEYVHNAEGYLLDITDAEELAYQLGLDDVAAILREELARIASIQE